MADIDVEAVERVDDAGEGSSSDEPGTDADDIEVNAESIEDEDRVPERDDAPEYVLYGGKGGVGKTTMAAATALASAAAGTTTLVVSTDPAHSLSDTFETEIPAEPARIRDDVPLYAAEIDPDAAMEGPFSPGGMFGAAGAPGEGAGTGVDEDGSSDDRSEPFDGQGGSFGGQSGPFGGGAGGPLGGLGDLLGGEDSPLVGGPIPGADEAAAMQQLLSYLDDPRFDRVVVDTAPTGHTLRLLELPEIMDTMLGRIVRMRERLSGMMEGLKGLFGGGGPEAGMPDLDELRERIERLRAVLRDPDRTDFRVVLIPEEMSVVESERLVARLNEYRIPVRTVVVNRVMEDLSDVVGSDVDPEWVVAPDLDSCAFCQRRWQVQQNALRRASDLFRGREVKRVPLLADEVRGEAALRVVAACLE